MSEYNRQVIAHRGASSEAPENTMAAFYKAIKVGADAIELDVHLSADGKLVVIHDAKLARTTDGEGLVGEKTVEQLKMLDAGSWFSSDYAGEEIPLLEEVFQSLPAKITIHVELKNVKSYSPKMEAALVDLIQKYKKFNTVIVSSFNHQALVRVKNMDARIRIGLLYNKKLSRLGALWYIRKLGIALYSVHPKHTLLREKDVKKFQRNGYKVYPWTVDSKDIMEKMLSYRVNGIMTNEPQVLKKMIEQLD